MRQFEGMSLSQLRAAKDGLEQLIQEREQQEAAALREEVTKKAEAAGIDVDLVLGLKAAKRGAKSKPKYRNPGNPKQTWTGKGRKPAWIEELLGQGKSLEELAI